MAAEDGIRPVSGLNKLKSLKDIASLISRDVDDAEHYETTHVRQQRERGYEYYYGQKLGNERENKSQHISKDVFNVVETAKAICLETFTQNKDVVYFPPQNADDYEKSKQANAYVNYVFFRENKGYKIMHDLLHDGFIAKNGIVKRWWKQETSFRIESFKEITDMELEALGNMPDVTIRNVEEVQAQIPQYAPQMQNPMGPQAGPMGPQGGGGVPPSPPPNPMGAPAMNPQAGAPTMPPGPGAPPPQGSNGVKPPQGGGAGGGGPQEPQIVGMNQETRYSGELAREVDTSHIAIINLPPEDFIVDPYCTGLKDATFVAHRNLMTKSDAREMGWDPEIIDKLHYGEVEHWRSWGEKHARHSYDRSYDPFLTKSDDTEENRKVIVYECYKKMDLDGDGISELYQVFYSSKKILQIDQVEEIPFEVFTPYPQPYKFDGLSIPDVIWDIQKSKSTIERQIIDNMVLTNNPRYIADLGFIRNPKDLLHNVPGTIINTTRMDAIAPLAVPGLNPQSFSVLEMLESDKEEATGATRLAQGMEKDAISKQNSFDTIQALTTAANRRLMMFAKHFAEYTLKPLFHAVYRLGMKYEDKEKFVMLNGTYVEVNPKEFEERTDLQIRVALTPQEQKEQAQSLMMVHQLMSSTPQLQVNYGPEQMYNLAEKVMENMNIDCREALLLNPRTPEFQQKSAQQAQKAMEQEQMQKQMVMLEAQLKQAQAQNLNIDSQVDQFKAQQQAQEDMMKIEQDKSEHIDSVEKDAHKLAIDKQRVEADEWYKHEQIRIANEELAIKRAGGTGI